jgi:predicted dehydrogenase
MRVLATAVAPVLGFAVSSSVAAESPALRVGMIGLDTSHAPAFTRILNDPAAPAGLAGCRVVVATPQGNPDFPLSASRVDRFTAEVRKLGVEIVDTVPEVLGKCDVVLLESVDGRTHLAHVLPVLRAGKPVFVDKPLAAGLVDGIAIVEAARSRDVPLFSTSALRFTADVHAVRDEVDAGIGRVLRVEISGPCSHAPGHRDLFWYGIHGAEALFTILGPDCQTVRRTQATAETDEVEGRWAGGRGGTFRGAVSGTGVFGGLVTGDRGTRRIVDVSGYGPLLTEIVRFFRTGRPPVPPEETLAVLAFLEAAEESKRLGGAEVSMADTLARAREAAAARLVDLGESPPPSSPAPAEKP